MDYIKQINYLDNLEFFANQVVEGFITGLHKSPYHGFSVEFLEHRLYNTGESIKHIDWKLFGRSDKLFTKRFEEETNLRCQLILDSSSSMYYPSFKKVNLDNPNKFLFSVLSSASLMSLFKKQRDAVGLSIYSNDVTFHSSSRSTKKHHRFLYHRLEEELKIDAVKEKRITKSVNCLHNITERLNKRSLVMIFTDMLDNHKDLEQIFNAFKHLKYNNHEVILFHLSEPKTEQKLEFENRPYKFIDSETGEIVKINPQKIKQLYSDKFEDKMEAIRNNCLKYKIDLIEVDINKGFEQILISYLLKRKKIL